MQRRGGQWRAKTSDEDMESMAKENEKRGKISQNMAFKSEFDKIENECICM